MYFFILKIFLSAIIIAIASWLSGKNPHISGLIIALPLMTLISLPFSYYEYGSSKTTIDFAKSIFFGLPVGWCFFAPFIFAQWFNLSFTQAYILGIAFLLIGFIIARYVFKIII